VLFSKPVQLGIETNLAANQYHQLPFFDSTVAAGFPSPADDHIDRYLNLNDILIQHPAATFIVRAQGESMRDGGINDGDLLVVDKALQPVSGQIVIAVHQGDFLVKRLVAVDSTGSKYVLKAENATIQFRPIPVDDEVTIWGVVTSIIKPTHPTIT